MSPDESPALWPDDKRIGSVDGAMYEMRDGHRYVISGSLFSATPNIAAKARVPMTRHIMAHAPSGKPVIFVTYNIDEIVSRRGVPMRDKASAVMGEIVRAAGGKPGRTSWTLSPHVPRYCNMLRHCGIDLGDEINWLLKYLERQGLISLNLHSDGVHIELPVEGLIEFEKQQVEAVSDDAFVAMWFNEAVDTAYEQGIRPAIESCGFRPVRIDRHEHNNKIDDEIVAAIRRAKFLIADFSCDEDGARGGVYFEAGLALGLNKPVIFTVRSADLNRVHFDTRQYNHIVWHSADELRVALINRIAATIGPRQQGI